MSLLAKIEAVIYASEDPVTLAQLVSLLRGEAQAELDALDSRQTSLQLDSDGTPTELSETGSHEAAGEAAGDQDALNAALLDNPGLAESAALEGSSASKEEPAAWPQTPASAAAGPAPSEASETGAATVAGAETNTIDGRLQERRLREHFRSLLDRLTAEYAVAGRGLEIREVAGGFRMATKPEYHDTVRGFVRSLKPPLKLSLQALETLAVVAYKQPITAPEIGEIRGVDSGGVLGSLLTRKLLTTAGRKSVIGRPILYKTTKEFLLRFGLKDLSELPSIEEFEKMAGDLNEAGQEDLPMAAESTSRKTGSLEPAPLDELNAAPEGTEALHDAPEDSMSDRSSQPEGAASEPSSGVSADAARDVEQSSGMHQPQADGDSTPTQLEESGNPGDDAVVDGRISGLPPEEAVTADADNPSAREAAEQASESEGA